METIPVPTSGQIAWQQKESGLFCHFGINTFHNKEWSAGQLDPATFEPARFDPAQWVALAQDAGMHYLILTAKHHDGFCLWPTETTAYSVASSPFRGDVVGEVAKACRDAGLPFGVYLSPWDRNAACYADPAAYDQFYARQLTELCTRYGELCELWFDGAGSEGRVYDWEAIMGVAAKYQPQAMIFNMGKPTIRWVGNEDGLADDPNFYAVAATQVSAFTEATEAVSEERIYLPPECDVPLRRNWFWQTDDARTRKTKEHLLGIYYRSVGRGANLLLNLGPNRDGLLDEGDCARVREVTAEMRRRFAEPLEARLSPTAGGYALDFGQPVMLDHLSLREDYSRGQRIDGYAVIDTLTGKTLCAGRTIGHQKWEAFPTVTVQRLQVEFAPACAPDAALTRVTGYRTGHTALPELGAALDYAQWSRKADPREADVPKWRG